MDATLACLGEDVVLINPRGEIARGRSQIRRELRSVLTGPALRSIHTSVVMGVEFVTAGVAIVDGELYNVCGEWGGNSKGVRKRSFSERPVRENCMPGSVRRWLGNWLLYRDGG